MYKVSLPDELYKKVKLLVDLGFYSSAREFVIEAVRNNLTNYSDYLVAYDVACRASSKVAFSHPQKLSYLDFVRKLRDALKEYKREVVE